MPYSSHTRPPTLCQAEGKGQHSLVAPLDIYTTHGDLCWRDVAGMLPGGAARLTSLALAQGHWVTAPRWHKQRGSPEGTAGWHRYVPLPLRSKLTQFYDIKEWWW